MALQTQTIAYPHGDTTLQGYLAWDDAQEEPRPTVIIAHAWAGRGDLECAKARKLAELGYVGFALDMYGGAKQGHSVEENSALMQPFLQDRVLLQQRMQAAVAAARQQTVVDSERIAVMGYCFGGLCTLDLARTGANISGAVSIHGLFTPPGNTQGNSITAKVLCLHGHDDPMAPPDAVAALEKELTEAGCDWQIHIYGNTRHAFTNPEANDPQLGTVYNPQAEKRAWRSLLNFLEELFD